jgi:serine/threonine protein kinase
MEPTAPSTALLSAALDALGIDGPPKHLSGRKGAHVWQAGDWTVKTAVPGARGHLGHEAAAYGLLHCQGLHPGARHGDSEGGRWLAVPWIDGRSVWEVFAPARDGQATDDQQTAIRQTARAALAALQRLHKAGWIHGDMQTENALLAGDAIEFIDYDNAHHPDLPLPHPYRGGLIHVIAPELAQQLAATGEEQHVPLTAAAELFALGASLYWAWTGLRITDYRGDPAGAHADLYADIAAGHRRDLTVDRPWNDPELEQLILGSTRPEPQARRYHGLGDQRDSQYRCD